MVQITLHNGVALGSIPGGTLTHQWGVVSGDSLVVLRVGVGNVCPSSVDCDSSVVLRVEAGNVCPSMVLSVTWGNLSSVRLFFGKKNTKK